MAKPTNKLQREVTELSERLPEITQVQKEWIFDKCLLHKGFATKTRVICMDCGDTFPPEIITGKRATCPHCHTKIKIENSRKRTDYQMEYTAMAIIHNNFQVIRTFQITANYKKDRKTRSNVMEILQYWIDPKGRLTVIGKQHYLHWYVDSWSGNWSIRKYEAGYSGNKYQIYPYKYIPGSKFRKEYTKFGINSRLNGIHFLSAISFIPNNPIAETLLKAKQYSLLSQMGSTRSNIENHWASIKICIRNKYYVKDAITWIDYLSMLRKFNKDLRNAKYVCPKNLDAAHKFYLALLKRNQDKIDEKERLIKEEKLRLRKEYLANFPYEERKAPYMGLNFSKGNIVVSFLESVEAIKEEGDILAHCIYENEYQNKDTLLFSAAIDNIKIATAEVDPDEFKVIQVRGYDNQVTEYDETIIKIIQKNMKKIVTAGKQKMELAS